MKLSATVNTLAQSSDLNRSSINLLKNADARPSTQGHQLFDMEQSITAPQRVKTRPLTWPVSRPLSYVDYEGDLVSVNGATRSMLGGL
jgi:hypothetical protein